MEAITQKAQSLSEAAMKIGEAVYQAQQAEAEAAGAADAAQEDSGDNVVDAEFEDVTEGSGDNESNDGADDGDQKAS